MKKILLVIFVFSFAWTQCDANGDGELNVVDIVQLINTILYGFNIEFINIEEGPYRVPGSNEILNLDYNYRIGKYEITNQQYLSYLTDP